MTWKEKYEQAERQLNIERSDHRIAMERMQHRLNKLVDLIAALGDPNRRVAF